MNEKKTITTYKDLWLFSKHKTKVYDLIARNKELTKAQIEKQIAAQRYFSKSFENWYKNNIKNPTYNNYIKELESKYPDFKH